MVVSFNMIKLLISIGNIECSTTSIKDNDHVKETGAFIQCAEKFTLNKHNKHPHPNQAWSS